jgi:prepilin-type N-terminal cleavage/methylation domain-containing protein/prepilin-type processing-associated H-X9-DG protein
MQKTSPMRRKGFTIIELLVVVAVIGLLVAILLPAIGRARESAQSTQSQSNLRNIGSAAAVYGVDFQDRQWSPIPDDFGRIPGISSPSEWGKWAAKRCSGQLRLGKSAQGDQGFFIPLAAPPLCPQAPLSADINNLRAYFPCSFKNINGNFGSFRLLNASSFNKYVGGRFYDDIFYAPKDLLVLDQIAQLKAQYPQDGDFFGTAKSVILSSYCWSPAAMWSPEVLTSKKPPPNSPLPVDKFIDPFTPAAGGSVAGLWRTPTANQATYSELKTRVIEHSWLQNKPSNMIEMTSGKWNMRGVLNPDQIFKLNGREAFQTMGDANNGMKQPWWFNEASMSLPNALFFDGHVGPIGVLEAVESNKRIKVRNADKKRNFQGIYADGGVGDLGSAPYQYGCYDNQAAAGCGMHMFTVDGIQGRDMLGAQ